MVQNAGIPDLAAISAAYEIEEAHPADEKRHN